MPKSFLLLLLSSYFLTLVSCSPKVKIGLWAKKHQDAAMALGVWAANNPGDATALLNLDCADRKQFKKKITDALNNTQSEQPAQQQGYTEWQGQKVYSGNRQRRGGQEDGFGDWCRKYPKAAKKLRSHAKAICKTGLGILNGSISIQ